MIKISSNKMDGNSSSSNNYRRNRRHYNNIESNGYQNRNENNFNQYNNQSVYYNSYQNRRQTQQFPNYTEFDRYFVYPQNSYQYSNEGSAQSFRSNDNKRHNYKKNNFHRNHTNNRNVETLSQPNASNELTQELANVAIANTSTSYSNDTNNSNSDDKRDETQHKKESNNDMKKKTNFDNRVHDRSYGRKHNNIDFSEKNKKYENRNNRNDSTTKSKAIRHFESDESQREIMDDLLRRGQYECMICCDEIKIRDSIWNCDHCYNVYHLKCIKLWANSESSTSTQSQDISWRCPACQASHKRIPSRYQCFCGKVREPELNRYLVPHSCGEMCGRKRKPNQKRHECPHKCMLLCHPGPCPPCQAKVMRECACGRTKITVNCETNDNEVICQNICNKALNCGQHYCKSVCHSGKCSECQVIKTQLCFCGKDKREVKCSAQTSAVELYSCGAKCGKSLTCGNHKCDNICHSDECNGCPLDPNFVTHCPCDKTELISLAKSRRKTCTDPIPTCGKICDKELICGPEKEHHRCKSVCHSGSCPPCDQKTVIRCRCGANSDNIECSKLVIGENGETNPFICKKRCNKKRQCGRHKCLNECCVDDEHRCEQICGKKLSCGSHTCEELCHYSSCPQCWNISWDELTCRCGHELKLPPIACGTQRPECRQICSRRHACDHPIVHNCHDDTECPPCTYLVSKPCFGGHEQRTVPCYENGVSCGFTCLKALSCGLHECQMICHSGDCGECSLPCNKMREDCEHICGAKCHQKTSIDCPKTNCKVPLKVSCDCGRKTDQMPCFKFNDEKSLRISMNALANARIKAGESISIADIVKNAKDLRHYQLKCDDKCAVMQRNKQLAEALDIKDADFSPDPGPPNYSEMLKNAARTDPNFVNDLFEKLTKLVMDSKQSKLSFKNLNFPPMNSENRHIVHELAEFFGCKTHAVDREPNRSVVVKAAKDKCYLPTVNLMDIIKDETESRKTAANRTNKITLKSFSFDQEINKTNTDSDSNENTKVIDYFDFKGD